MEKQNSSSQTAASLWLIRIVSTLFFILYRILNRTKVYGREKLHAAVEKGNVVAGCNHVSALDSFCLSVGLVYAKMIRHRRWSPISSPKLRPEIKAGSRHQRFMEALNCVFINLQDPRQQVQWLREVGRRLKEGCWTIIFGTGTRNVGPDFDQLGDWLPGAAALIRESGATFIPIAIFGTQYILPKGAWLPRMFQRVVIVVGDPIVFDNPRDKEGNSKIMAAAVQAALTKAAQTFRGETPALET